MYEGSNIFFAKRLRREEDANRLKMIHEKLIGNGFEELIPIIRVEDERIVVQAWQDESRVADFSLQSDRTNALQLLNKLHAIGNQIDWRIKYFIPDSKVLLKWQLRLLRFQQQLPQLVYYFPKKLLQQLIDYAEQALSDIQQAESKVQKKQVTLLHGDVVHHNFLICADGKMRLIDFDLAQLGEPDDELLLWMHRVLPNMNYQLSNLLVEQPTLQMIPKEKFHRLKYPNELLREWLYVLTLHEEEREPFLDYLYPFTDSALSFWPKLWYDSDRYARK